MRTRGDATVVARAERVLLAMPGVQRVLRDDASDALVVRGSVDGRALRRALQAEGLQTSVAGRSGYRRSAIGSDHVGLAVLILLAQLVLVIHDFGLTWPALPVIHAGASAFVMIVLGAPVLREAALGLARFKVSAELVLTFAGAAAWLAGAVEVLRLEAEAEPYFILTTAMVAATLVGQLTNAAARASGSDKIRRSLHLMPMTCHVEGRHGIGDVPTRRLKVGQVVHVDHGGRFPTDGLILSGTGVVDEATINGSATLFRCGPGDAVLAGTTNLGEPRRVEVVARPRDASVATLARLAAMAAPVRRDSAHLADTFAVWVFGLAVLVAAGGSMLAWTSGDGKLLAIQTFLLVLAVGVPPAFLLAASVNYGVTALNLRRWGIWTRDPSVLEKAGTVTIVALAVRGVLTEGSERVLKVSAVNGNEVRILELASALVAEGEHQWATTIRNAAIRNGVEVGVEAKVLAREGDGILADVQDGPRQLRIAFGRESFMAAQNIPLNPNFIQLVLPEVPEAIPLFLAVDGHAAGAVWLSDPVRQTAPNAIRSIRGRGIETCVMGDTTPEALELVAGTVGADSYIVAEPGPQQAAEVQEIRADGQVVAMVGHPARDSVGLSEADLAIGLGALNSPAAARPGFLLRHADPLLVATCFSASQIARQRLAQSLFLATVPGLAAVGLAALQMLTLWPALGLFAAGIGLVAANSARMVFWRPRFLQMAH